ncbi:MAG: hypothetical protein RLZZ597_451, partial [Cyanobacteriota bacterium]
PEDPIEIPVVPPREIEPESGSDNGPSPTADPEADTMN